MMHRLEAAFLLRAAADEEAQHQTCRQEESTQKRNLKDWAGGFWQRLIAGDQVVVIL